mmetsp:Transcript_3251/g.6524  ORF Transcript_3251/g.6524 Transcript_3251/m.6524 type:complete len:235 (-) Transcript_3251:317-1021(-)
MNLCLPLASCCATDTTSFCNGSEASNAICMRAITFCFISSRLSYAIDVPSKDCSLSSLSFMSCKRVSSNRSAGDAAFLSYSDFRYLYNTIMPCTVSSSCSNCRAVLILASKSSNMTWSISSRNVSTTSSTAAPAFIISIKILDLRIVSSSDPGKGTALPVVVSYGVPMISGSCCSATSIVAAAAAECSLSSFTTSRNRWLCAASSSSSSSSSSCSCCTLSRYSLCRRICSSFKS